MASQADTGHSGASARSRKAKVDEPGIQIQRLCSHLDSGFARHKRVCARLRRAMARVPEWRPEHCAASRYL